MIAEQLLQVMLWSLTPYYAAQGVDHALRALPRDPAHSGEIPSHIVYLYDCIKDCVLHVQGTSRGSGGRQFPLGTNIWCICLVDASGVLWSWDKTACPHEICRLLLVNH